jgi:hypothetical protein
MSEGPAPRDERRSWVRRHWWWFVPLGILVAVGGVVAFGMSLIAEAKKSVPYNLGLELVQSNTLLQEKLGQPIESCWRPPDGNQAVLETGSGQAERRFTVFGPKGEAEIRVKADCEKFLWTLREVRAQVKGAGEVLLLELPPEGDPLRSREEVSRKNFIDPY